MCWVRSRGTEVSTASGGVSCKNTKGTVRVYTDCMITPAEGGEGLVRAIQLEFKGRNVDDCRWIQFVKRIRNDKTGQKQKGWSRAQVWHQLGEESVDTIDDSAWYEGREASHHDDNLNWIADQPDVGGGGLEEVSQEDRVIADAYLVCCGKVLYAVHWELVAYYEKNPRGGRMWWRRAYENVSGGPVEKPPEWTKQKQLFAGWSEQDASSKKNAIYVENPLFNSPILESDED